MGGHGGGGVSVKRQCEEVNKMGGRKKKGQKIELVRVSLLREAKRLQKILSLTEHLTYAAGKVIPLSVHFSENLNELSIWHYSSSGKKFD